MRPRALDLFCGLGGWTDGLLAEGYDVTGYDIEAHEYGDHRYPGTLVLQDVRTLNGAQFKDVALIVASPPCQEYSYMAMPWKLAKAKARAIRDDTTGAKLAALNDLFNQCFRIQHEASVAAGRHIPMVVENVRGAQPWVGRARWNFGSFYLWGDVPALMPATLKASKVPGFRFDGSGKSFQTASVETTGFKSQGMNWSDQSKRGQDFTRLAGKHCADGRKADGSGWRENGTLISCNRMVPNRVSSLATKDDNAGLKCGGDWFGPGVKSAMRQHSSKSPARKHASAMIAKIPLPLSRHVARSYRT